MVTICESHNGSASILQLVRSGRGRSILAVGSATGRNPIGIIVPCHRLVGADGSLTGYAGGLERKRYLLDLEQGRLPLAGWPVAMAG